MFWSMVAPGPLMTLVEIPAGGVVLRGDLVVPSDPQGIILFAHGSGSSRKSPRNQAVARIFEQAGMATLLVDLLSEEEQVEDAKTQSIRFDIPRLGQRVSQVVQWIYDDTRLSGLRIGIIGSSTGAAAALIAASEAGSLVSAVVGRGGRPDLAKEFLPKVSACTLLIVGELDRTVLEANEATLALFGGEARLVTVPGASHLFEEPGTLERAAKTATLWFQLHL